MERFVEVCQGVNARRDLMLEMALGRVFSHSQPDLRTFATQRPLRPGGWPCWLVLHEPQRVALPVFDPHFQVRNCSRSAAVAHAGVANVLAEYHLFG
jgi:hypothetical protein